MLPFRDVSYKIPTKKYLEYVNNPDQAIKQFVKDYHLNPNKPERMNVLNTNRRDNRVQLFDFDEDFICRWQTKDKSKVLEQVSSDGYLLRKASTNLKSDIDIKKILKVIPKIKSVEGRFEKIGKIKNKSKVILDFAHTLTFLIYIQPFPAVCSPSCSNKTAF